MTIYTIGHSTRPADEFADSLVRHGVRQVVDVRKLPGSRRFPHFNAEAMAEWLGEAGIAYVHEPGLGGRRSSSGDSPNTYWENASFRAFADYMRTPEFEAALERLIAVAGEQTTAIMCSEAVPWRCHRQLIADALVSRGVEVRDIVGKNARQHALHAHAHVEDDGRLRYV
ncbi:MAG TPA: DUF488 domain-containing protein [Pirellulales bacterium]|jgi:uncharacterized protein (DUF488 family)|nr:DUF488 domain-containing protein [Pirellulales bacterium]